MDLYKGWHAPLRADKQFTIACPDAMHRDSRWVSFAKRHLYSALHIEPKSYVSSLETGHAPSLPCAG